MNAAMWVVTLFGLLTMLVIVFPPAGDDEEDGR